MGAAPAWAVALLILGQLAGCGGATTFGQEEVPIKAIWVEPRTATLTLANGMVQQQRYTAWGYADKLPAGLGPNALRPAGGVEITDSVTWGLDVPTLGRFVGSTLRTEVLLQGAPTAAKHGGKAVISAWFKGVSGRADLSVFFRKTYYQGVPPGTETKFTNKKIDPKRAIKLVYPTSGVLLPPNLNYLDVQWAKGNNDLFELRITNALLDLRVYTKAASYNVSNDRWTSLAYAARDGQANIVIQGTTQANPAAVGVSGKVMVQLAKEDITSGLYYWETSQLGGVFRYDFQYPKAQAVAYYTQKDDGACVGCHAISRAGDQMAFVRAGLDGWSAVLDVKKKKTTVSNGYQANIQTFSPLGTEIIVGTKGKLERRDATTGKLLGTLPTGADKAAHPDWSPDGKSVVYVSVPAKDFNNNLDFENGSISLLTRKASGSGWNAPKRLVAGAGLLSNYYPSFGPKGEWIVFNRSMIGDCYSAEDANIFIVRASGGKVTPLARINGKKISNSWPRWSPMVQTFKGQKLYWLTFSSIRDYGTKLMNSTKPALKEIPQVWMAAFSPAKAAQGMDPTYPPFWLHFQKINMHNHIAQWAEKIVQ